MLVCTRECVCNCLCAATDRLAAAKSTAVNAHLHLMPSAIVSLCVNVCVYLCAYVYSRNYRQARARTQCHLHILCVTWAFILFACAASAELKFYEFL